MLVDVMDLLADGADVGETELHAIGSRSLTLLLLFVDVLEVVFVKNDLLDFFFRKKRWKEVTRLAYAVLTRL